MTRRHQARTVLEAVRTGTLAIDDFHRRWPAPGDPLIDLIFDETEDTVEHVPGVLFRRGDDGEEFRRSIPYKTLVVDAQFLRDDFAEISSHRLVEIRGRLLKRLDLSQDDEALARSALAFITREVG